MVGTIFVNFLSHSLASFSSQMTVEVIVKKGHIVSLNGLKEKTTAILGSAQFGFSRNILVEFNKVENDD